MAKKKSPKDYEQFSKRLSKWVLIFWAFYRFITWAAVVMRPDVSVALHSLTTGVDEAAMCVVISYTVNSTSEKAILNYFAVKAKNGDDDEDKEDDKEDDNG